MEELVEICKVSDVPPGEMRAFQVAGEDVAIANLDGEFVAFGDICTHASCSLSEGDLGDLSVVCPCHGSEFDLRTGEPLNGPATEPVDTWPVHVEADALKVEL